MKVELIDDNWQPTTMKECEKDELILFKERFEMID